MLLRTLVRIWTQRILWICIGATVTILFTYLPAGYPGYQTNTYKPYVPSRPLENLTDAQLLVPNETYRGPHQLGTWSFKHYKTQLRWYWFRLKQGEIWLTKVLDRPTVPTPVLEAIRSTWWTSFRVFLPALFLGSLLGVLLGTLSSASRWVRSIVMPLSLTGVSLPDFLWIQFGWAFSIWTFSKFGFRTFQVAINEAGTTSFALPFMVLCLFNICYMTRLTLGVMQEIQTEDYIRTAHAKGVPPRRIWLGHVVRNAIPRILNGVPMLLNATMSSILVLEVLYRRPGLGYTLTRVPDVEMAATIGLFLCVLVVFMDGLTQTIRVAIHPLLREVGE